MKEEEKGVDYNECPHCGGGPVYQDRHDARRNVAHCDDCGEELTAKEYARISNRTKP